MHLFFIENVKTLLIEVNLELRAIQCPGNSRTNQFRVLKILKSFSKNLAEVKIFYNDLITFFSLKKTT